MNSYSWILSFIIIVVNLTTLLSAPFEGFYFPDKFEKMNQDYPEKLNRQLIFDHDYHVDDHRRYNHQQHELMHGHTDDDHTAQNNFQNDANSGDDDNSDDNENSDSSFENNNENNNFDNVNNHNTNSGQFDSDSNNNGGFKHDWQNGNSNTNGLQKDFPAVANTVCESRCNNNGTPQYNPICGNDGLIYYNSGRMNCAQICGKSVQFVRMGLCSSVLIN